MEPTEIVDTIRMVDLVPIGVWLTLLIGGVRFSRMWGSVETAVVEVGKKVDKVGDRVGKLEAQTGEHAADIAYIRGKMET